MFVHHLAFENIGPFIHVELDFRENEQHAPVVMITGENGTGKSIILDAIRGIMGQPFGQLNRNLARTNASVCQVKAIIGSKRPLELQTTRILDKGFFYSNPFNTEADNVPKGGPCPKWILDFWSSEQGSTNSQDSFRIDSLSRLEPKNYLSGSLSGNRVRADVTKIICHFDYMRDSRDSVEKELAAHLYATLEKIIAFSLLNGGKLSHVARAEFEPVIVQNGQEVKLSNLSSGNLYLIQNLLGILFKMHAVHVLRKTPLENLCDAPGFVLIDEAENQLHPKWQKRLIPTIRKLFPNLQIIATTHSPFIIASASQAKLFVCRSKVDHCVVEDISGEYTNRPVDEILMSPLFEETQPFNEEITHLIDARKRAVEEGNETRRIALEQELKQLNQEYFSYFDVDEMIAKLSGGNRNAAPTAD